MITRREVRARTANYLNSLSRDDMFNRFGITRLANLTGLDVIGVPVYSSVRPAGKMISTNAGKSLDKMTARAGAIAEAIEFATFENLPPSLPMGAFSSELPLPLCEGSNWTPDAVIPLESVCNGLTSTKTALFPADLVWLHGVKKRHHFQASSNGQALGGSFEDALVQGICECVERDAVTLRRISLSRLGVYPPRVELNHEATQAVRDAHLEMFLFHCTVDIPLPVYWTILADPSGYIACGGWGCAINPVDAAVRSVLEAIQSRLVCIAGARDDLARREINYSEQRALIVELMKLPISSAVVPHNIHDLSDVEELEICCEALREWKESIFYKHIQVDDHLHAVKVQILGLEQPMLNFWKEMRWSKLKEQYDQVCSFP